jgi:hypothetical protein
MRFLHEMMVMHAALPCHRRGIKKHIHQHGFSAPDTAMDVNAPGILIAGAPAFSEQPKTSPRRFGQAVFQAINQKPQTCRRSLLIRI